MPQFTRAIRIPHWAALLIWRRLFVPRKSRQLQAARVTVGELFEVEMFQQGLRPLAAAELSDRVRRYILFAAALLSPRPPELMI